MAKKNGNSVWEYTTEEEVQEHALREWTGSKGTKSWAEIKGKLIGLAPPELIELAFPTALLRAKQETEAAGGVWEDPDLANFEQFEPTVLERVIGDTNMEDLVAEQTATEHSIRRPTGDVAADEPAPLPG